MKRARLVVVLLLVLVTALVASGVAAAAKPSDSQKLRKAVTVDGILKHENKLQSIADANGDNRASGTPGYDASRDYVVGKLEGAGYNVEVQPFEFSLFTENAPSQLEQTQPTPRTYVGEDNPDTTVNEAEFTTMEYSGSGNVTAAVTPVDVVLPPGPTPSSNTSGCEASDFASFPSGNVALLQRGTCTFGTKAQNAQAAGASAVLIFNEGQAGRTEVLNGTLGGPGFDIPVLGTTFEVGNQLATAANNGGATVRVFADTNVDTRTTYNVIASTKRGDPDQAVVVGAHLDSVAEGPGINDNGSGTSTILEMALQASKTNYKPRNQIRFAFWGAEESGLLGSEYYVSQLDEEQLNQISANLNFDMLGSPNYVRFVYDGDGSDTPDTGAGPDGSGKIERIFNNFFADRDQATDPTAFDGRSDYGPFIAVGIPAGGLFSGAEGIKTPEQAAEYGGTPGVAYDPCYHQACDDITNLNNDSLNEMSNAAAHATVLLGNIRKPVTDTTVQPLAKQKEEDLPLYKGPHIQK